MLALLARLSRSQAANAFLRESRALARPGWVPGSRISCRPLTTDISASQTVWPSNIKDFLEQQNIVNPTPIQERTLPLAMQNRDIVGIARTGSGKTLAFVVPAVMKILENRQLEKSELLTTKPQTTCLVLAPTRELANQTAQVFGKFRSLGVSCLTLVGGSSRSMQVRDLQYRTHDAFVATPGRLIDLLDSGLVDLSGVKYLVMDEADMMLDMGFEPQIRRIIDRLPNKRQTLMWSATWPLEIQDLAADFMQDFEYIKVDSEKLKANPNIKQIIKVCRPDEKVRLMLEHLSSTARFGDEGKEGLAQRTLIFVNTKRYVDMVVTQLFRNRHTAVALHGDRNQNQRDMAVSRFKKGLCNIMVATNVAARGLDISDISDVMNFDFPPDIESYIHRIGRTARHDKSGNAVSFVTEKDAKLVPKLIKVLQETGQPVDDELKALADSYGWPARQWRQRSR